MISPYVIPGINRKEVEFDRICKICADEFGLLLSEFFKSCRKYHYTLARYISWHIMRHFKGATLKEIGKYFGKHHATILNGLDVLDDLMKNDEEMKVRVERVITKVSLGIILKSGT